MEPLIDDVVRALSQAGPRISLAVSVLFGFLLSLSVALVTFIVKIFSKHQPSSVTLVRGKEKTVVDIGSDLDPETVKTIISVLGNSSETKSERGEWETPFGSRNSWRKWRHGAGGNCWASSRR